MTLFPASNSVANVKLEYLRNYFPKITLNLQTTKQSSETQTRVQGSSYIVAMATN